MARDGPTLRSLTQTDRAWVARLITERWGAETIVAHGAVYHPHKLPGFVAIENDDRVGLVTYHIDGDACEIVTLDSLHPNRGIGTALIDAVKRAAQQSQCRRLWLITTNDNLHALRFYQKRGFVLAALHRGAVNESRKLKPEIPLIGMDGISIRDEVEMEQRIEIGD